MAYTLGKDARVYVGSAGSELASLNELTNTRDVTVTLEAGEIDVTTRSSGGYRATAQGFREMTVEVEMLYDGSDTQHETVRDAYLNGTNVELAVLTGPRDQSGSNGPKGTFSVSSFTLGEPLEEAVTATVRFRLVEWDEWVEVTS